jgi:YegS/Rv2252/BmrU family lipid kinase
VKVRAIVNPRAGTGSRPTLPALRQSRRDWEVEIALTDGPGHARDLARDAAREGAGVVLAVGGDGTANEVAEGLLGSETVLGLVPVGSGNGLARALRIPLAPARALACLERAESRPIDVGLVDGRPFLNVAGAGLDAEIGAAFHAHGLDGGRRGVLGYVREGARLVLSRQPVRFRLEADGLTREWTALLVTFANGPQYGGGAVVAPRARLDDGLLEVVAIEDASLPEILANAPRLFLGGVERFRRYRRVAVTAAVLTGRARHHRDGEPQPESERIEVGVRRGALRVLVPRETTEDPTGPFATPEGRADS